MCWLPVDSDSDYESDVEDNATIPTIKELEKIEIENDINANYTKYSEIRRLKINLTEAIRGSTSGKGYVENFQSSEVGYHKKYFIELEKEFVKLGYKVIIKTGSNDIVSSIRIEWASNIVSDEEICEKMYQKICNDKKNSKLILKFPLLFSFLLIQF